MQSSVWTRTLAAFREQAGGTEPVPAGVAISAVTASMALALLAKVLALAGNRKNFTGDRQRLGELLDAARAESTRLARLADDDIQAFERYMESRRREPGKAGRDLTAAIRQTIEVPMEAARTAVRGLGLCAEAAGMIRGITAADIGAAAALLSGAVKAMLLSVDFNVRQMQSKAQYSAAISEERRDLELQAVRRAEAVSASLV